MKRFLSVMSAFGVIAFGFGAFGALPVMASTTFNVPCGNIALLEQAVATSGATVNLAAGCTYQLNPASFSYYQDALPVVSGSLTINGHVLNGHNSTLQAHGGRIFEIQGGSLTLNYLTLSGGNSRLGGGIYSDGTLRLNHSQVINNVATVEGGGIFAWFGSLSLSNSRVTGNHAVWDGGGIYSYDDAVSIYKSVVAGNAVSNPCCGSVGGGIFLYYGTAVISLSSITSNTATTSDYHSSALGGGIFEGYGSLNLTGSAVKNNGALNNGGGYAHSGGLYSVGAALITSNSAFSGNYCLSFGVLLGQGC